MSEHAAASPEYLDAKRIAERFGFSKRHWDRLVDSGRAPQPLKFGSLNRWSIKALEEWESAGCPRCERRAGQ